MELNNTILGYRSNEQSNPAVLTEAIENMLIMLSPFCPHICDELWDLLGWKGLIYRQAWPATIPPLWSRVKWRS